MNGIPVESILPNPDQPRTIFDEEEMRGLAQSIKQNGLIQPIVVEDVGGEKYVLIDGERRLRAVRLLGWVFIDAVVRPPSEGASDKLMRALVANVQRSQMGFVDEAKAYQRLESELGSVAAVAEKVGVGANLIYSRLRLLQLAPAVQEFYNLRQLPFDLSVISVFERLSADDQERLASIAVTRGLRVTSILRTGARLLPKDKTSTPPGKPSKAKTRGHFNALALVDGKPTGPVKAAAIATCKACPVYKDASPKVCGHCPLPNFLNILKETK